MKLPDILENLIESEVLKHKINNLKEYSHNLSNKYMNANRTGKSLLSEDEEAIAYSVIRMPATFGAIKTALDKILENNSDLVIKSLLDIGAGTGAGSWAANEVLNLEDIICVERENAMSKFGMKFMANSNSALKNAEWINIDILKDDIQKNADLVIVSYMINELREEDRNIIFEKLLNMTNKILLIVEPGTPEGFKNIKKIRKEAIKKKLNIIAPCTHYGECRLPEGDWCSSSVRVQRNKIHKLLKSGDVPFEDEKFSYIAISKVETNQAYARILRHPIIQSKIIKLKLCTEKGIDEIIVTKKYSQIYKETKKKNIGDSMDEKINELIKLKNLKKGIDNG